MKKYQVKVNGYPYEVEIEEIRGISAPPSYTPAPQVSHSPAAPAQASPVPNLTSEPAAGGKTINAPMQGKILDVKVSLGEEIVPGQVVAVLEAMKMENEIVASEAGTVIAVNVTSGQSVDAGDVLVTF